jgi:type IV secretory pathway VirB6-like protein
MTWIVDRVSDVVVDATQNIYEQISADGGEFKDILNTMVALTIMFYALSIMLGITQASGYAALMFLIKIVVVWNLATNFQLFYDYVIEVFESFVLDSVEIASQTFHQYQSWEDLYGGGTNPNPGDPTMFSEIDKLLSIFWDFKMAKVIMALMFTGITGFFWALMLLLFMLLYLMSVISAIKTYLFALIARHMLYALAPIFLSFALFNQTKSLFDGYIEQLINFSLQPVFLFIFLGLFHSIIVGFVSQLHLENLTDPTNYDSGSTETAKEPCIAYVPLESASLGGQQVYWYKMCFSTADGFTCQTGEDQNPVIPIDIWMLISAIIVAYLMYKMSAWVIEVATRLSSGYVNVSEIPVEGFNKLQGSIKGAASSAFSGGGAKRGGG